MVSKDFLIWYIFNLLKSRILILFISVVIIVLLLWGGQILINRLSGPQKEVQEEILRRESALMERMRVEISDSGYKENRTGTQSIYLPAIVVEITNISRKPLNNIRLEAYFKNRGAVVCFGEFEIDLFRSREKISVVIVCSQTDANIAAPGRPDLTQMDETISFELWLKAPGIAMVIENGKVEPTLLLNRRSREES